MTDPLVELLAPALHDATCLHDDFGTDCLNRAAGIVSRIDPAKADAMRAGLLLGEVEALVPDGWVWEQVCRDDNGQWTATVSRADAVAGELMAYGSPERSGPRDVNLTVDGRSTYVSPENFARWEADVQREGTGPTLLAALTELRDRLVTP
jgi:hypothetical protein